MSWHKASGKWWATITFIANLPVATIRLRVHLGFFEAADEVGAARLYAAAWAAKCGLLGAGVPAEEILKVLKGRRGRTPTAKDLIAGCKVLGVVLAQDASGHWS